MYAPGSGEVLRTLSSELDGPNTLAFNYSGDLCPELERPDVLVFAAGTSRVKRVISQRIDERTRMAFDRSGNLYVVNDVRVRTLRLRGPHMTYEHAIKDGLTRPIR